MKILKDIIIDQIHENGPMDIGVYMSLCLGHPEHGYYMKQDPFGKDGDFTTAPEISQMFGEMLGIGAVDLWLRMGEPEKFYMVECGPGRGTLMEDALRGTKSVDEFHAALELYLMETSSALCKIQKEKLGKYSPVWVDDMAGVPDDAPLVLIANEFLDALPVRQLQKIDDIWMERTVGLNDSGELTIGLTPVPPTHPASDYVNCIKESVAVVDGNIFEFSSARENFIAEFCQRLKEQKGVGVFIDYGHVETACGDTLQAVKSHEYVGVLDSPGDVDLTSHVDFARLKKIAIENEVEVFGPITQGDFLKFLQIDRRAALLMQSATSEQARDIESALHRLTDSAEMGGLFKVMILSCA